MSATVFLSILALHFVAAMSPGPSFVVSVRTAASEGFRPAAGLAVAFGLGALIWAMAALFGLAIVFEVMPKAYLGFKIAGGLFLIWIGYKTIRHAPDPMPQASALDTPRSMISALRLGLMTQLANPKPAIFFGAVFAGLIPPDTPMTLRALLLFFVFFNESMWYLFVAAVFSRKKARDMYTRAKLWTDRALGGMIVLFGLKIAAG
ncbi:LysE family translocator [Pacificibacter marinus]|uniref:Threonine efflux protein n=1 Tax=Pacificibacter marinus TaxID=658057 RepID=A0A1Y5SWS4_9RHOB|nr:LysE family transporter [Pacificibacter marinus]SEK86319.1 Threonine/homoserine/homoserine lactone efflux protein [Pacificibacter marinus]SLN50221.1 Threonine efflux protein [Pacificibacter marinus]